MKLKGPDNFQLYTNDYPNGLIVAPHSAIHRRPSLSATFRQAEKWTEYIAKNIASEVSADAVVANKVLNYDPNFAKLSSNPVKKFIKKSAKSKDIKYKYVIGVHGLSDRHEYDFAIYYPKGFHKSRKLAYKLAEKLLDGELRGGIVHFFELGGGLGESISSFSVTELKIPSIQVEIARYIREDGVLREAVIENISKSLKEL